MDLQLLILLLSLTVSSAVNLTCTPQTSVCDGQELVCNCTSACNSDAVHWWDNRTATFCTDTKICGSDSMIQPGILRVEVIDCPTSSACSDIFTSRLSYNASLSHGTNIQIGCSSAVRQDGTCSPERDSPDTGFVTLLVTNCTAPHPPRNLQFNIQDAQCNSSSRNVTITWEAPDFGPSQLQETNYSLTCTGEDSCTETLPADITSYNLTVDAGVQYTVTVSALSNGRESQNNPHLNFTTLKVVNESTTVRTATIRLQDDFKSNNLTISSLSCSGASFSQMSFEPPAVHLNNLTADTMYCYLITYDGNNTVVAGSCNGTFSTTANTTSPPTTDNSGKVIGGVIGGVIGATFIAIIIVIIAWKA